MTFTEQARAKRKADAMAIIGRMSLRERADLTYAILCMGGPDDFIDAIWPVQIAFENCSKDIDNAIEADELDRMHPEDRRAF